MLLTSFLGANIVEHKKCNEQNTSHYEIPDVLTIEVSVPSSVLKWEAFVNNYKETISLLLEENACEIKQRNHSFWRTQIYIVSSNRKRIVKALKTLKDFGKYKWWEVIHM